MNVLKFLGLALVILVIVDAPCVGAQESHPSDLTANDLAEMLSIHWWTIQLPKDLKPKDMVGVEIVSADGKRLEGGGGVSSWPGGKSLGNSIKIFCWEDEALRLANVRIKTADGSAGGFHLKDYFKSGASFGSPNGAVLKVGDVLIKFSSSPTASFSDGDALEPGQVGLRVVITRKP